MRLRPALALVTISVLSAAALVYASAFDLGGIRLLESSMPYANGVDSSSPVEVLAETASSIPDVTGVDGIEMPSWLPKSVSSITPEVTVADFGGGQESISVLWMTPSTGSASTGVALRVLTNAADDDIAVGPGDGAKITVGTGEAAVIGSTWSVETGEWVDDGEPALMWVTGEDVYRLSGDDIEVLIDIAESMPNFS